MPLYFDFFLSFFVAVTGIHIKEVRSIAIIREAFKNDRDAEKNVVR